MRASGCGAINAPPAVSRALVLVLKCEAAAEAILSQLRSEGCDTFLTKPELVKMIYDEVRNDSLPLLGKGE